MMKKLLGAILVVLGSSIIVAGFYFGIWWCFILGIAEAFNAVKSPQNIQGIDVALIICRIIFCEVPVGLGLFIGGIINGCGLACFKKFKW
jgi:hypothetical protein